MDWRKWRFGQFAIAVPLALICITYSLVAEFSLSSNLRGDVTAQRAQTIEVHQMARGARERALSELDALPTTAPLPSLRADLQRLRSTPGAACDAEPGSAQYGPVSRSVCPRVADIGARIGIANRRAELAKAIAMAEATLATQETGAGGDHADETAANLVAIARVFGINWTSSDVAAWLVLLVPLFLEIGSSLGLVVAASFGGVQSGQRRPVEGVQVAAAEQAETPVLSTPSGPEHQPEHHDDEPSGGAKAGVIKLLEDRGGHVQAGQRGLAKLIGTSTTRLNQVLQELVEAGIVHVTTHRSRGTEVRLAD